MKKINNISISLVELPQIGGIKKFNVRGDDGAKFILIVTALGNKYYDFVSQEFSTGHSPRKILRGTISGSSFEGVLSFGELTDPFQNYDILLFADPSDDTEMKRGRPIVRRLRQLPNTTLTVSIDTSLYSSSPTSPSSLASLPSNVTVVSPKSAGATSANIDWTFTQTSDATRIGNAEGAGLIFENAVADKLIVDGAWYFNTTDTVNGTISGSTSLVVDSTQGLFVGMTLQSGASGFTGAKPVVIGINTITNTLTLSKSINASDGDTLTFRGYGLANINSALNCSINANLKITNVAKVTTTVRGAVSNSTTVTVNGTRGINGQDDQTFISGLNSTPATVSSSNASATAGDIEASVAQTFNGGETLTFTHVNSSKTLTTQLTIEGSIKVNLQPKEDQTIYFDLDKILSIGNDS